NKDFFLALDELESTKKIKKEIFMAELEKALTNAFRKQYGEETPVVVDINPERNIIRFFACRTVVEEVEDYDLEISLEEARELKKTYKVGDTARIEFTPKEDFGRIAAQTAKQVLSQNLKAIESQMAIAELSQKEEELAICIVRRVDNGNVYVDMGKLEAVMFPFDQVPGEKYNVNDRVKVFIKKVKAGQKGPQISVSRSCPEFVQRIFEQEVPEIAAGIVTIKNIVREAGYRTKVAVYSDDSSVDAVGACVGNRGLRINSIVSEINGEKIDIIPWCSDALEFIARSLSPAKVLMVHVDEELHTAKVIVPDDKLSLAIGKSGMNARLAVKLTGWKIDVKSLSASQSMDEFKDVDESTPDGELAVPEDVFQNIEELDI
ncbi:MAG: transcription termination factor NusA, partial [Firmicutes bacterium]|nr:transcription termination factor NusA [Bacillota bacterium]